MPNKYNAREIESLAILSRAGELTKHVVRISQAEISATTFRTSGLRFLPFDNILFITGVCTHFTALYLYIR